MHELKVAESLMSIITDVAQNEKLKCVNKVNIQFGKMIQIVPDIFRFAFEEAVKGTVAEGAEMHLEILPVKMKCYECGKEFSVNGDQYICPICQSDDLDLVQGKETLIKSIEGEK